MNNSDVSLGKPTPADGSFVALRRKGASPHKEDNTLFTYAGSDESCLTCFVVLHVHSRDDVSSTDALSPSLTVSSSASSFSPPRRCSYLVTDRRYPQVEMRWSYPHDAGTVLSTYPELYTFSVAGEDTSCSVTHLNCTFVLTDSHGVREYGHVTTCVNGDVMVALSRYPWCNFFYRVAALYACNGDTHGKYMIETLVRCPTPPSGAEFATPAKLSIAFRRPYDRLCAFIDTSPLTLLGLFPDTDVLLGILADLLLEKHIVVVGPSFTMVSLVVMSLQALIAPFDWVHILISILPSSLIDVLAAPPPYLVGMLTSQLPLLRRVAIERAVMVHLSASGVCERVTYVNEDAHVLPHSSRCGALRVGLSLLQMRPAREQTGHDVCSLFLSYYATLFGNAVLQASRMGCCCWPASSACLVVQQEQRRQREVEACHAVGFYSKLLHTQSFHILAEVVRRALAAATDDGVEEWLDNEFIVAVVRSHRGEYARQYAILMREEKQGGGYVARYSHCFGSQEGFTSWTAAIHGFGGHRSSVARMIGCSVCCLMCRHASRFIRGRAAEEAEGSEECAHAFGRNISYAPFVRVWRWFGWRCGAADHNTEEEVPVIVSMTNDDDSTDAHTRRHDHFTEPGAVCSDGRGVLSHHEVNALPQELMLYEEPRRTLRSGSGSSSSMILLSRSDLAAEACESSAVYGNVSPDVRSASVSVLLDPSDKPLSLHTIERTPHPATSSSLSLSSRLDTRQASCESCLTWELTHKTETSRATTPSPI